MWDYFISQFYHYLYFILFFVGIFIIILIACYGKKTKKSASWSWDDMNNAFASFHKKKAVPKKHEQRCRVILENLFRAPFPSIRPDFLRNKTGKNLELDGYNEQLGIAFEYQGIQHRTFTPRFHKSREDFKKQKERDAFKKKICEQRGIRLLEIPDTVPYDDLEMYIITEVRKWYEQNDG